MSAHPETASKAEFARINGCTPAHVTRLKEDGRLVLTDDGKRIRVAESLDRIRATRDPAMKAVTERHAKSRGVPLEDSKGAEQSPVGDDEDDPDFQKWRARKERAAALREEIRLKEEAGELIRRADAVSVVASGFTTIRSALEELADNVTAVLPEDHRARARIQIAEEVEHMLSSLSDSIGKLGQKGA